MRHSESKKDSALEIIFAFVVIIPIFLLLLANNTFTNMLMKPIFIEQSDKLVVHLGQYAGTKITVGKTRYRHYCADEFVDVTNNPCNRQFEGLELTGKNLRLLLLTKKSWFGEFHNVILLSGEFYMPNSPTPYFVHTEPSEISKQIATERRMIIVLRWVFVGLILGLICSIWRFRKLPYGE